MAHSIPEITASQAAEKYGALFIDAFGVLVNSAGALPHALEFLEHLRSLDVPYLVVTNDASKLPATSAATFQRHGLPIDEDQIITSGSLIAPYFEATGLTGARCLVLGPADSHQYVAAAGGEVIEPSDDCSFDALVVCDDAGYPFLNTLDLVLTALFRHFDRGDVPALVLPNSDIIYPRSDDAYGFTSGAAALLLETALARRYPQSTPRFVRLGKPHRPIYREALRRIGSEDVAMIGDQVETDIAGARGAGIDAILIGGVSRTAGLSAAAAPNYLLRTLAL